tara:strand:+ start:32648 stop:33139 length:492 start_codon:yes stop_codon:yes gene_type:complete
MNTISMLFFRGPDGEFSKIPVVAEIPTKELIELNKKIEDTKGTVKTAYKGRVGLTQEVDIRRVAAKCESCNLCMVCSGKHRKYESWPPGGDQCFVHMIKSGKPIRDEPCKLCDVHDREIRVFKRAWAQGLSKESAYKNIVNNLIVQRRALYKKYQIVTEVVTE